MAKVLVTGASGFIGGHLAERLVQRGDQVRCLVRSSSSTDLLEPLGVELAYGDLSDDDALTAAVADVEIVYHLAAMTSAVQVADLFEANAAGTERLAAACSRRTTPPKLVAISSIAASGPIARDQVRTEDDTPAPISDYGRSKLAGEQACRQFADDVPTTIVRASIVFGPRNQEMLPILKTLRRLRCHAVPTWQPPPLSFIHVDDLLEILLRAAGDVPQLPADDADPGRGIYFATMEEHPTYAEFGRILRPMLNRPFAPIIHVPSAIAYAIAGANQRIASWRGKSDSFNVDKIREATASSWACSPAKTEHVLGFRSPQSLPDRLRETVAWYQSTGWL